ncbi:MAG: dUTP diphosphatase [Phycisphaerales bacterium]|nr:MAG: dUTP diphosphatase [Phycisphaerales bacterium]
MRKLNELARVPAYQTPGAAGLDLAACLPEGDIELKVGEIARVPTGLAMAIPSGFEGQVRPRSGLSSKGITVVNAPGTIDADYRGELQVLLINLSREPVQITHGMRIAQIVIAPVVQAAIEVVESLDETVRGVGGFGSTGH